MAVLAAAHIRLDEPGVAWIDNTNTKVVEVALDLIARGWSPGEIHFQNPRLSLAKYPPNMPEMIEGKLRPNLCQALFAP